MFVELQQRPVQLSDCERPSCFSHKAQTDWEEATIHMTLHAWFHGLAADRHTRAILHVTDCEENR